MKLATIAALAKALGGGSSGGGGGGGSGVLVEIGIVEEDRVQRLNKTGQEILNYVSAGSLPFIEYEDQSGYKAVSVFASMTGDDEGGYSFAFGPSTTFFCDTLSDYPA